MSDYSGRTAVITGGTSGFGLVTAQRFVEAGGRVIVTGRSEGNLERARDVLGASAVAVRSDTSSLADVATLAKHVRTEFDAIDLLFVNAGVTHFASLADTTEDKFDELFAINAKGPYFTVQALAPLMRAGGGIVLTTSVANTKGLAGSSAYAATKAAVRSMVRSFARELADRGVRVNAVSPGPIDTGILERALPAPAAAAARAQMTGNNPMSRFGEPGEIADAVLWLGLHATYSTGSELAVDGGTSQL